MTLAIKGMRRPNRSESRPKITAPTGRNASVAKVVAMMAFLGTLNWWASVSYRKTMTKKSKASRVQPRKPARTACCAPDLVGVVGITRGGIDAWRVEWSWVVTMPQAVQRMLARCVMRFGELPELRCDSLSG